MKHPKLKALAQRVKDLQRDTEGLVQEAVVQARGAAVELQKEQMQEGTNAEDKPIKPFYTEYTKKIKRKKGQPTDRVTLKDTGAFYQSISAEAEDSGLLFSARDRKTSALKKKYGSILGLGPKRAQKLSKEHIKPLMQQAVREYWKSK